MTNADRAIIRAFFMVVIRLIMVSMATQKGLFRELARSTAANDELNRLLGESEDWGE